MATKRRACVTTLLTPICANLSAESYLHDKTGHGRRKPLLYAYGEILGVNRGCEQLMQRRNPDFWDTTGRFWHTSVGPIMVMLMYSIYPRANLVTKIYDGCAMRVVFSKLQTVLISATVTLGMVVVHSNMWDLKLRRHVNHMWQSLYKGYFHVQWNKINAAIKVMFCFILLQLWFHMQ